jgi:hypothetical protein
VYVSTKTPVLVIGHSRPKLLEEQIKKLLKTNRKIFLFVDGPRSVKDTPVRKTIDLARHYSNNPRIELRVPRSNLGCKWGPISAIDWAFESTESLIILEDDVEFTDAFLLFADWALSTFAEDEIVHHINGFNPISLGEGNCPPVFLSRHAFGWGWATWKNRWVTYDSSLVKLERQDDLANLILQNKFKTNYLFEKLWWTIIQRCKEGHDAWDYQWSLTMWQNRRRAVTPRESLTRHVGVGEDSTHFKSSRTKNYEVLKNESKNPFLAEVISHYDLGDIYPSHSVDFQIDYSLYGVKTQNTISALLQNLVPRVIGFLNKYRKQINLFRM